MSCIALKDVSKIEFKKLRLAKYYHLTHEKGSIIKKKFVLFPFPHFKHIIAKEDLYNEDYSFNDDMTKEELENYDNIIVIDKQVYWKPSITIYFLDGEKYEYYYKTSLEAEEKFNELIEKFNLKKL